MLIRRMTATFGKLREQTLELQEGLNILQAPNETGKSTWCAFLLAMLYGVNTKERDRSGVLADKNHYAPWSGGSMSCLLYTPDASDEEERLEIRGPRVIINKNTGTYSHSPAVVPSRRSSGHGVRVERYC